MATSNRARSNKNTSAPAAAPAAPAITLEQVIAATKSEQGFMYTPASFHDPLIESGDVVVNREIVAPNGDIATRATAKHLNESSTVTETNQSAAAVAASARPSFVIETDVAIPDRKPRAGNASHLAGRTETFPFGQLAIKQSFFVPNPVDAEGNPVKDKDGQIKTAYRSMSSTVASANERSRHYVEGSQREITKGRGVGTTGLDYIEMKKFQHFDTTHNGLPDGTPGTRIFRIAPVKTSVTKLDGTVVTLEQIEAEAAK